MTKLGMTRVRAARALIYLWLTNGGTSPWFMDCEEMTEALSDFNYKVTEKRRAEIIKHIERITEPLRRYCAEDLRKAGYKGMSEKTNDEPLFCPYCGDELDSYEELAAQRNYFKLRGVCSHWDDSNQIDEF